MYGRGQTVASVESALTHQADRECGDVFGACDTTLVSETGLKPPQPAHLDQQSYHHTPG
jgi:hypothetical protein